MQANSIISDNGDYLDDMNRGRPSERKRTAFGERVFNARQATGLSQTEVAERLGITQSGYAAWERDVVALRPDQLTKLAVILRTSADHLLGQNTQISRITGPTGKVRKVFERVSQLPRHQQSKVVEFVEAFVDRVAHGH